MARTIPEKDWKYLRSIEKELLTELCRRINQEALEMLQASEGSEHERYLRLFRHYQESDRIVADCFDDWRRSNVALKLLLIRRHRLLTVDMIANLTEETRALLANWPG